ncbi:hypothetical protein HN695_06105 [Candidatus Woesearchaeota archaeon]|jgi:hypothetical protein|nr:hypothetical protein [Candidatus Woesearchaeota archaeon]MBT5272691.1 hypothetical protein [Candidatus Woesearchaeota archaeon]MBT6040302.1 hypothetical protein [Candidatus Woesearchaeota archaeon]MBT6337064.1 hypothetical protein [Candidatus Woesearchaeota archaeon]MBT7927882.1 hypothetical protein [Candidatus Woesearchaeota archaeon]
MKKSKFATIKEKINKSTIFQSLKLFFSKPSKILFMILVDLVLIALIMLFSIQTNFVFTRFELSSIILFSIVVLINALIMTAIYTLTKLKLLNIVFGYLNEKPLQWSDFKKFWSLNILLFLIIIIINFTISLIVTYLIKQEYHQSIFVVAGLILMFFLYPFVNLVHYSFCKHKSIKKSFSFSLKSLSKSFAYMPNIFFLVAFIAFYIVVYLINFIVAGVVFKTSQNILVMQNFAKIVIVCSVAFGYLLYLINRVYFLNLIREK